MKEQSKPTEPNYLNNIPASDLEIDTRTCMNGKTITILIPRSPKGLEIIDKLDEEGKIDTATGFADRRNEWKKNSKNPADKQI
jgi:hypothetical protein